MAKYLYREATSGRVTEKVGTASSSGGGNAGEIPQLDAAGRIDSTMMPVGFGDEVVQLVAGESLTAGDFIGINTSGQAVRASAAPGGFDVAGFVLAGYTATTPAIIYFEGANTGRSALTLGARYYLSDSTPGGVTTTPVVGSGKRSQLVGIAISTTSIALEVGISITLA